MNGAARTLHSPMTRTRFATISLVGLGLCAFLYRAVYYPRHLSPEALQQAAYAKSATAIGVNPQTYVELKRVERQAETTGQISLSDFALIRENAQSPVMEMRVFALTGLRGMKGSPYQQEAEALAQNAISDPLPVVRQYGLSALLRLDPEAARTAALQMQNETNGNLKEKVDYVLASTK